MASALAERQARFLADLIRIRSYTGQEGPAVERTLAELRAIGCDEVWTDSAGNALGRIGRGPRVILYDAHLDTNEVADERAWPHPPLEPTIEGDAMFGLGASDCKGGSRSHRIWGCDPGGVAGGIHAGAQPAERNLGGDGRDPFSTDGAYSSGAADIPAQCINPPAGKPAGG